MNKQELVRNEMVKAMKEKDKPKKETLSLLLAALKNAEIDKMGILSESEEDAVVQKEIKQTKETLDLAPADRTDIIQECKYRIEVLSQFAPKMMTEEEIEATIAGVLNDLGMENPTKKEKCVIYKMNNKKFDENYELVRNTNYSTNIYSLYKRIMKRDPKAIDEIESLEEAKEIIGMMLGNHYMHNMAYEMLKIFGGKQQ